MANDENLRAPWKKGQSGNPSGRKKGSKNRSTIAKEMLAIMSSVSNPFDKESDELIQMSTEEIITAKMIIKAQKDDGDVAAYRALLDSAYGTPKQTVETIDEKSKPKRIRFFSKGEDSEV